MNNFIIRSITHPVVIKFYKIITVPLVIGGFYDYHMNVDQYHGIPQKYNHINRMCQQNKAFDFIGSRAFAWGMFAPPFLVFIPPMIPFVLPFGLGSCIAYHKDKLLVNIVPRYKVDKKEFEEILQKKRRFAQNG